ncbi:MAG: hypothetical protein J6T52_00495 [Bacteroidaceae bacterium]|nr:hypothetical protein [Bacteroidaceae bacterium]
MKTKVSSFKYQVEGQKSKVCYPNGIFHFSLITFHLLALFLLSAITLRAQMMPKVYSNASVEASEEYQKGNKYQKDFLLMMHLLETTHPAFTDVVQAPFKLPGVSRNGYRHLARCTNDLSFQIYLESILSKLNDGHTVVNLQNHLTSIYPLSTYFDGKDYYLQGTAKPYKDGLGKKIKSINGVKIQKVVDSFKNDFSYENEVGYQRQVLKNYLVIPFYWNNKSFKRPDNTLLVTFADSTTIQMSTVPAPFQAWEMYQPKQRKSLMQVRSKQNVPFSKQFFENRSIAYLQFNQCMDQYTLRKTYQNQGIQLTQQQDSALSQVPNFHEFLRDFFREVKEKKIKTLVVDVRHNSGGNSELCLQLLSYLRPYQMIKTSRTYVRCSPFYKQFYQEAYQQVERKIREQNSGAFNPNGLYNAATGKNLEDEIGWRGSNLSKGKFLTNHINQSVDSLFVGNIVFIQDEDTYSSAGMLITMAYDNNIGVVIGGPSSYNATSYGDILPWSLPNTQTTGTISHKLFLRPNYMEYNDVQLHPDEVIIPSWEEVCKDFDPCWSWVLKNF